MLADAPHLGYGELDSRRERHGINRLRDPIQGEVFKLAEAENSSGRHPKILETSRIEVSG